MSRILIIAPHMDDEVLGMGGTIIRHVKAGDVVCVVFCANRVYNHVFDEKVYESEKKCALAAKKILRYQEVAFLGLHDERLDTSVQNVLVPLEHIYDEFQPDVLYSCYWGDNNQDHRGVFEASRILARPANSNPVKKFLLYEVPSSTEQTPQSRFSYAPNLYVDICSNLELKLKAFACYEKESREFPHPRSPEGISLLAKYRGVQSGLKSAEAFMLMREVI